MKGLTKISWDSVIVSNVSETLLANAPDSISRARLVAGSSKKAGAWLTALPVSSLGLLQMDGETIQVAVDLQLGSSLCRSHLCQHCEAEVNELAIHGLSCRWSEGRHHRHSAINDMIHHALTAARVPSRLEPAGLYRSDGKRPDGITVVPWMNGQLLVWDATCPDTFSPS